MTKRKNINRIIVLSIIIIMSLSTFSYGENDNKTLLIMVDNISFSQIERLDVKDKAIGLMNLKTRKPYTEESIYKTLNVGRKISGDEIEKRDMQLDYLGDILKKEGLFYWGDEKTNIDMLIADSKGNAKGSKNGIKYDFNWLAENIDNVFYNNNIMALEYNIDDNNNRYDILNNIIKDNHNKKREIYIIPKGVSKEDSYLINDYFVPVTLIGKGPGTLSSQSTKRKGIIAIEDISENLKLKYNKEDDLNIGKPLILDEDNKGVNISKSIYDESINLLIIASIFHGLLYLSQGLMLINIINDNRYRWMEMFYLFTTNNIFLTILMSFTGLYDNLFIYLPLIFIINLIITRLMYNKREILSFSILLTYILILFGIIFKPDIIYNSYMGFNNLVYGARFYGFNNGMAAVFLATSIIVIWFIHKSRLSRIIKNFLIFIIPILNIIVLSTKLAANTGGFITAILLFLLNTYYYFVPKGRGIKTVLLFLLLAIIIFGINIYVDSLSSSQSHAIQFINRIKENGMTELFYMASFKLKELIKLTIMPPFSLVLIAQFLILREEYRRREVDVKILLITGIIGFLINDTGNILLIYMLNYLILRLYFYNKNNLFSY